jgi:hypothetical protein
MVRNVRGDGSSGAQDASRRSELQVVFVKEPVDADEVVAKVSLPRPPPSLPSIR